jgi:hypothetical protein
MLYFVCTPKMSSIFRGPIKAFKDRALDFLSAVKQPVEYFPPMTRLCFWLSLIYYYFRRFHCYNNCTSVLPPLRCRWPRAVTRHAKQKLKTAGHDFHADFKVTRFLFFWDLRSRWTLITSTTSNSSKAAELCFARS